MSAGLRMSWSDSTKQQLGFNRDVGKMPFGRHVTDIGRTTGALGPSVVTGGVTGECQQSGTATARHHGGTGPGQPARSRSRFGASSVFIRRWIRSPVAAAVTIAGTRDQRNPGAMTIPIAAGFRALETR